MRYKTCILTSKPNIQKHYPHGVLCKGLNCDFTEEFVWDTIERLLLDSEKYVHHVIMDKWIENTNYPPFHYLGYKALFGESDVPEIIPLGDLIYTIKVYYD